MTQPTQIYRNGELVASFGEWTPEELEARERAANEQQLRADPQTHIDVLLQSLADIRTGILDQTNATINQNPASYIKQLARELSTAERRLIRVLRLQLGVTDSTDTGD